MGPNNVNFHIVSDLYAEVIGVLAQARYEQIFSYGILQWMLLDADLNNRVAWGGPLLFTTLSVFLCSLLPPTLKRQRV